MDIVWFTALDRGNHGMSDSYKYRKMISEFIWEGKSPSEFSEEDKIASARSAVGAPAPETALEQARRLRARLGARAKPVDEVSEPEPKSVVAKTAAPRKVSAKKSAAKKRLAKKRPAPKPAVENVEASDDSTVVEVGTSDVSFDVAVTPIRVRSTKTPYEQARDLHRRMRNKSD